MDEPCALLSDGEAANLGFAQPAGVEVNEANRDSIGCHRASPKGDAPGVYHYLERKSNSLDSVYESGGWTYFMEMTVGGLPAVAVSPTENPPATLCVLLIAAAADQSVEMTVSGVTEGPDVCERVKAVGEVIVARLRVG